MHKGFQIFLGLPKSIYFNFKYFGLLGIKLPILVSRKTKFIKLKGVIHFTEPIKTGMVRIGIGGSGSASVESTKLELNGNHYFGDKVVLEVAYHLRDTRGRFSCVHSIAGCYNTVPGQT